MSQYARLAAGTVERVRRCFKGVRGLYKDSPVVFIVAIVVVLVLLLSAVVFSLTVSRLLGARGAVIVDLVLVWLFARLVARALMFPGSLRLFQRNTEASFRSEMARQYQHYLRQLWSFLRHVSKVGDGQPRGVTADGVARGCAVVETLVTSFRIQQQQHEVKLSKEQEAIHTTVQELHLWLAGATLQRPGPGPGPGGGEPAPQTPLLEWVRKQAACGPSYGPSLPHALAGFELAGGHDGAQHGIEKLEKLLAQLDDLRSQKHGMLRTAMRFIQVPAIGSLNQLRTELQLRHAGQHCWVPTRGRHRLDAMFLPCDGGQEVGESEAAQEDAPLRGQPRSSRLSGPTLVWCNPNAAYYETMVYQPSWLNFWLSRGINIFFFNYAGYGRSTGKPSPGRIAEDGDSVLEYLKSRGITQVGIYGRSIGGVVACHLARRFPDMVRLLIADRTMSTLEGAAECIYGNWAAKGLRLTAMMADNVENFWEVRCYKLLICDPKDAMILDLAALRTGVALRVISNLSDEESLPLDDAKLQRLADVWRFFAALFAICESDDDAAFEGGLGQEALRAARQPNFTEPRSDVRLKAADGGAELQQGLRSGGSAPSEPVGTQWLEDNAGLVRSTMALLVDQVRSALDVVGEHLEGGGVTLSDVFADNPTNPVAALRCMLANLQVWGTLGEQREDCAPDFGGVSDAELGGNGNRGTPEQRPYGTLVCERDVEQFLRRNGDHDFPPMHDHCAAARLAELQRQLSPEMLSTYHRRLSRTRLAQARHEFRRRLSALRSAIAHMGGGGADLQVGEQADRLLATVLHHLAEVDAFVSGLSRFFKSVDLALPDGRSVADSAAANRMVMTCTQEAAPSGDSSDEKCVSSAGAATPRPAVDHSAAGFLMHTDCGHNGTLDETDLRQLALHLRSAGFGGAPCGS